jgi:hypothetical protein
MKDNIKKTLKWFTQTSTLVGAPVLLIVCLVGVQRMFFTASCHTVGWRCEYAFGATDAMVSFMGEILASNPGMDVAVKPRGTGR